MTANRKNDINELLSEVNQIKKELIKIYSQAKDNEEIKELPKIKIKSAFEHLRSALDYIALDIHAKYYNTNGKIYFPYADNEINFQKYLKGNFNDLINKNIRIYKLIKSVQSFNTSKDWLTTLCEISNTNKHRKLSKQEKNLNEKSVSIGNLIHLSGNSEINFGKNGGFIIDGQKVFKDRDDDLIISVSMDKEEIIEKINTPYISSNIVKIKEKDIEFFLDNNSWDALDLIETSLAGIETLFYKLYKIL